jgi:hypothetical protein
MRSGRSQLFLCFALKNGPALLGGLTGKILPAGAPNHGCSIFGERWKKRDLPSESAPIPQQHSTDTPERELEYYYLLIDEKPPTSYF